MRTLRYDLGVLGLSLVAAIGAVGWYAVVHVNTSRVRPDRRHAESAASAYRPSEYVLETDAPVNWLPPIPQRGSKEWVYDLFTPPEIYYDALAMRFSVSPPKISRERAKEARQIATTPLAGVRLRGVAPGLFRLQLVGFFRSGSSDLGLFQNVQSGETFLAGRGRVVSALGLFVESVRVGSKSTSASEDSLANQTIATATIKDQQTGTLIELSTLERCYAASARGRIQVAESPEELREVASGDLVELNGEKFAVLEVRLSPPSVTLSRVHAGSSQDECFTLECGDTSPSGVETPSA